MENILEMLVAFAGSPGTGGSAGTGMLGLWQSVVNFVMAEGNEVTLLGVFAWLFILGVSSIRRLITGI